MKKKKKAAAAAVAPKKMGRPPFEPTAEQRGQVLAYIHTGYGQGDISLFLGIAEKTLREHFREELDFGLAKLLAGAVNALGRMAIGAPAVFDKAGNKLRDEVKPDLGAICFLLKTRGKAMGWSERLEVTAPGGGPVQHTHTVITEVEAMIHEETRKAGGKLAATRH